MQRAIEMSTKKNNERLNPKADAAKQANLAPPFANSRSASLTVSVVIPAYNCEDTISSTLDSLANQTIHNDNFEVIIINDGSTDATSKACEKYIKDNDNFMLISLPNGGVSRARNVGINHSRGKYITFLDADDTLDPDTLEKCSLFFDAHYHAVDLVTYPMKIYNESRQWSHVRETIFNKTGVYDMRVVENAFAPVTNVNVFVKNTDELPRFDEALSVHEDELFNLKIMLSKQKVGFCKEGAYRYRQQDTSAIATKMDPKFHFEQNIGFWETLFATYSVNVPVCVQALFLHEIRWKKATNLLYPYHIGIQDFIKAMNRYDRLIQMLDDGVILACPRADVQFKNYIFNIKYSGKVSYILDNNKASLSHNGKPLLQDCPVALNITNTIFRNGNLLLKGFISSLAIGLVPFSDSLIHVSGCEGAHVNVETALWDYRQPHISCNKRYAFEIELPLCGTSEIAVDVSAGHITIKPTMSFTDESNLDSAVGIRSFCGDGYVVSLSSDGRRLRIKQKSVFDSALSWFNNTKMIGFHNKGLFMIRVLTGISSIGSKAVYLYAGTLADSSDAVYNRFLNDIKNNSTNRNVCRYYICTSAKSNHAVKHKGILKIRSFHHRWLLSKTVKTITDFTEIEQYFPYAKKTLRHIADLISYETESSCDESEKL